MAKQIDPAMWSRPDMKPLLTTHDIAALIHALGKAGMGQRRIAELIGRSQSRVSDIATGRRVLAYDVLVDLATGLCIPPERLGLSWWGPDGSWYGSDDAYPGEVTVAEPLEGDEMLRRQFERLLGVGAAAAFGVPVPGLGTLDDVGAPPLPAELPGRIGKTDVAMIRTCRQRLALLARIEGGQAKASVALAQWADQWLDTDASDAVRRELLAELAHLHTITAWCCHDVGAVARSHYHFGRSVEFAIDAGDGYQAAFALRHAGMMLIERGAPNNALKVLQLGDVRLSTVQPGDPRVPVLQAGIRVVSGLALSRLGNDSESVRAQVHAQLAQARDGWEPPSPHARACMDLNAGHTYLHLGQLVTAEATLAKSMQTCRQSGDRREGVVAELSLARLHVQAGEPRGLVLAKSAIDAVAETRSAVARQVWLPPLAEALEARPSSDARELAQLARRVGAARW